MSESMDQLKMRIQELQAENKTLADSLKDLQQAYASYEEIIGDNNISLLRSDMARMELE